MSAPVPFDLSGKTAIVTGASRGLGQYMARALARAGANIILTSREAGRLELFRREVEAIGSRCMALPLDVRDEDSIKRMADAAVEAGPVDILVNNAGCNVRKRAAEVTWADWNLVLETNLRGTFFVAQAIAARSMIPRRYGRIINIGSVTSVFGYSGLAPLLREPRRHEATYDEPCGRLGRIRHYGKLSCTRVVQNGTERRAV